MNIHAQCNEITYRNVIKNSMQIHHMNSVLHLIRVERDVIGKQGLLAVTMVTITSLLTEGPRFGDVKYIYSI